MEIRAKARRWGNSIALIIPKSAVDQAHIKPNQDLVADLRVRRTAADIFGILPKFKKSTQELKDEARKGWD